MSRRPVLALPCLVLICCLALSPHSARAVGADELARLAARAERVEILRDDFGVPHVYGETDADTVFGLLYAQAEDDFPRVERNYAWAIGRLAEAEGVSALYSDLRARLYMSIDEARAAYAAAPAWLQALCDAFADGLNYYLATHPGVEPRVIERFEPWMPMFFFEGSIGGDIERISLAGIEGFYGERLQARDASDPAAARIGGGVLRGIAARQRAFAAPAPGMAAEVSVPRPDAFGLLDPLRGAQEPRGSNGFAIAGERTRSGNALLLINPHTSFYFRGEVHAVSEEGLNAYGAVTWGQFFVYQGFNADTGWMHTSTGVDFMDEFVEQVEERDGELAYRYGDAWRPLEVSTVTLRYREGDGLAERSFPRYRTHHGPITHRDEDGRWVATRINWDPANALRQSWLRTRQHDYNGFRQMMDIRTNSSNNTVYADSGGNIAYFHGNFIPRRDRRFDYARPVDGSDPATDWQGLHPVAETIHLLNPPNGWLQNCNSTPFTAAGEYSPARGDYPVYMAPDDENFRAVHALRLLPGVDELTLDGLVELAYDPALPGFETLIGGLLEAAVATDNADPELAEAAALLGDWDYRVRADSVAMTLAHFYAMRYYRGRKRPAGMSFMQWIDSLGTDTAPRERLAVLRETLDALASDYGDWRQPWGAVNRFQRLSGAIDAPFDDAQPSLPVGLASGRWGALAAYGSKRFPGTKKLYGYRGNSFVAVVEFGERLRAKTLLAGGQSNDPQSVHFDDQAQRYVDAAFKEVAFYRRDVEARAQEHYRPGQRRD